MTNLATLSRLLPFAVAAALGSALAAQNPLQSPPVPAGNPVTPAKTVLGKILFWEEQMSSSNRVACGTCHKSEIGGGDNRRAPHPGLDGVAGNADDTFGSPGVINSRVDNTYQPDTNFGLQEQVTGRASPSFAARSPTRRRVRSACRLAAHWRARLLAPSSATSRWRMTSATGPRSRTSC